MLSKKPKETEKGISYNISTVKLDITNADTFLRYTEIHTQGATFQ